MLVFVPQGFVALVFVDGRQVDVLEQGVAFVQRPAGDVHLHFVDLRQQARADVVQLDDVADDWFV